MRQCGPIRSLARYAALTAVGALVCAGAAAQARPPGPERERPAPPSAAQRSPTQSTLAPIQRHENPGQKAQGEHLAGWLDHHSNLTPQQQQQALEKEPGFHDLPPQTQQRMRQRLTQLDNMSPEQRSKLVSRTEALEKLTPEQRTQVRSAMQQLAGLPPASRRAVSRTFRNLREMPADQRSAYLNSPDVKSQLSDQERSTLSNLVAVEPYLPPRSPNDP